jgi:hypothetical protein
MKVKPILEYPLSMGTPNLYVTEGKRTKCFYKVRCTVVMKCKRKRGAKPVVDFDQARLRRVLLIPWKRS